MADASPNANNGVNVQALLDARDALTKAPQAAQFKWRAACEWKNGTHSHSTGLSVPALGRTTVTLHEASAITCDATLPRHGVRPRGGGAPMRIWSTWLAFASV